MRTIFSSKQSLQFRLFFTVMLSLAGIVADARFHLFDGMRLYINSIASPILHLADVPREVAETASEQLRSRSELVAENQQLRQQLYLIRSDQLRMAELSQENRRLRELLGSPVTQDSRKMVARILAVDTDPFVYQIVIDKGIEHHVYEGQPVVNDQGVIGQVISVGKTSSRVLLITDVSHSLPIRVLRNDIRGIASGTGNINELIVKNLPKNVDIKEGDILVTSGLGGHFPEGYPVAKVTHVSSDQQDGSFADIQAEPLATLDRLRYVLLLWDDAQAMGPLPMTAPVEAAPAKPATTQKSAETKASEKSVVQKESTEKDKAAKKPVSAIEKKEKTASNHTKKTTRDSQAKAEHRP